jgi:sulfur relay (sulfurtransferase) DsrC/TusE family protein
MPIITLEGRGIELDTVGYLVKFSEWSRTVAVYLADQDEFLELGNDERHWFVLELLRDLYKRDMLPESDGEILFLVMKGTGLSVGTLHMLFGGLSIPRLLKWSGIPASAPCGRSL